MKEEKLPLLGNSQRKDFETVRKHSRLRRFISKIKCVFPYLWPKKSVHLQIRVIFCFVLLAIGRIINIYVPIYSKLIVNSLTYPTNSAELQKILHFRWDLILIYCGLRFLQGGSIAGGALNDLRSLLWVKIDQYTTREVKVALYTHLHSLSMRWHISRKTGKVLASMDRGTTNLNRLFGYTAFQVFPTIIDIIVAIIYFSASFNAWFGLIVLVTMLAYIAVTFIITDLAIKFRRIMNDWDNEAQLKGVDSLINFEMVKYYNTEDYEVSRFLKSILELQKADWMVQMVYILLTTIQNVLVNIGYLVGSLLCVYLVVKHEHKFTVGDYVLFASYVNELYTPLNFLSKSYRRIQESFTDMENMLELLNEEQEVCDSPNSSDLQVTKGKIEFRNVTFFYVPEKRTLNNISFIVQPGATVAMVGPSGCGKSTIIRLLLRFYDIQRGKILIDGQDISQVKQKSLRQKMGIVPQDTVLFNDDIRYNIRYGRVDASDREVEEAAEAAEIHSNISMFPNGYDTTVGERGLKLSGGEKQRVAIARTILKAPDFVLLDEATSALDTQTERNIQASLNKICQGKTAIIVAHRLSTIVHADEILVLDNGIIVERGRHQSLLDQKGTYSAMWAQQLANKQRKHLEIDNLSPYKTDGQLLPLKDMRIEKSQENR